MLAVFLLIYDIYYIYKGKPKNFYFGHLLMFFGFVGYLSAFLFNDFTLEEVFTHSSRSLPLSYKLSASWSGSGGYIVWWMFVFTVFALIYRLKRKNVSKEKSKKYAYHNVVIIVLFLMALLNGAFNRMTFEPSDGLGLNPLLKSVWMYFHPPATFIGYALGLLAAIDVFFEKHNLMCISLAWLFITIANVLGAVWSYFTLGWGGYWAWDPVETSLLLPWLTLTAYFHSVDLRNSFLALTGFSIAYAAFVTRGGVSFLHGFAVSYAGAIIILVGLPFLLKFLKEFKLEFKNLESPANIASISLLGIYIICILGLIYQNICTLFKSGVSVSVDYYNYLSFPFVAILLLMLPLCKAEIRKYVTEILIILLISTFFALITAMGFVNWCDSSPAITNAMISFMIPIVIFSLAGTLYEFKRLKINLLGLKIIHFSIPLLIFGILVSGPYAYHQSTFETLMLKKGEEKSVDGLKIKFVDANYIQPAERVSLDGMLVVPEESKAILKFKANNEELEVAIRFNFPLFLKGRSYVISEPSIINAGLDEYYFVIPPLYSFDLFFFHSKFIYQTEKNEFVLKSLAKSINLEYEEFINKLESWQEEKSHMKNLALITYKRIPCVNLVWIALTLMVCGQVLNVVVKKREI